MKNPSCQHLFPMKSNQRVAFCESPLSLTFVSTTGSGPLKFWSVTRRDSIQIKIIVK